MTATDDPGALKCLYYFRVIFLCASCININIYTFFYLFCFNCFYTLYVFLFLPLIIILHLCLIMFLFAFIMVLYFLIYIVYLNVFSFQNSPLSSVSGSDCESVSVTTCSLSSSAYTPR